MSKVVITLITKRFLFYVVALVSIISTSHVVAEEFSSRFKYDDFLELYLNTGPVGVTGHFSEQRNPNTFGFAVNVFTVSKKFIAHPSFLSVGSYGFSLVSKDSQYPFPEEQGVDFSIRFLNLLLPVYSTDHFSLYLGLGYALIAMTNTNENKYLQNYGSDNYEIQIKYDLTVKWNINYISRWMQINQYQNGNFSFIEMWSHQFGVGYLIF